MRSGTTDDLAQTDLDERGVQSHRQGGKFAHSVFGARLRLAAALA